MLTLLRTGCGLISSWFVTDLMVQRASATTSHIIQAIGSSSTTKGSAFVTANCNLQLPPPKVYTSYSGVYNDPAVDIVYIGTPHALHLANALAAIEAGKHVLCEKPLTINAADAKILVEAARQKGVFLMEGQTHFCSLWSLLLLFWEILSGFTAPIIH
jgi:dihydrodiol dehydrogenase / D-xylose 1-dehydrogenase (NADP)